MAYDINSIESLTFREGVRQRINMYLGSDDLEGAYQALKEIINNSTDEALAGYGDKIEITLAPDNTIYVRDYGRGVPFGCREDGENVLVSIYTKSHTGGKFSHDAYKNSSGLNGIGGSCVCLSSTHFTVASYRDGTRAQADFAKGELTYYTEEKTNEPNGTFISFQPDPEVFKNGDITYDFNRICDDVKNISYLYNGITFICKCGEVTKTYLAKNGIVDFVKDNLEKPLHPHIISGHATDGTDSVEIAFQWGSKHESSHVFVNGLKCPEGGSPITGAKTSITKVFNNLAKSKFDGDAIRDNLFYVINCTVANPSFANQTKTKINNASLRTLASNAFTDALKEMAIKYRSEFDSIVELLKKIERAEAAAEKARQTILNAQKDVEKNQKRKVFASDKLKDAEHLGQDSMLLLVEGDSAASSIAMARDIKKYGILALRGKMLNLFTANEEKTFQNEEIKLLLSAMNISPGKYNPDKLRYGKIGILTDADADGYAIGLLIMCALYKLAPQFIEEGRLCWLRTPLFLVSSGKTTSYYFSDDEFNAVRSKIKGEVHRAKGLGALSPKQARESMFSSEYQRIDTLIPDDETLPLLLDLMGDDSAPKRKFIFENIDFNEIRE